MDGKPQWSERLHNDKARLKRAKAYLSINIWFFILIQSLFVWSANNSGVHKDTRARAAFWNGSVEFYGWLPAKKMPLWTFKVCDFKAPVSFQQTKAPGQYWGQLFLCGWCDVGRSREVGFLKSRAWVKNTAGLNCFINVILLFPPQSVLLSLSCWSICLNPFIIVI